MKKLKIAQIIICCLFFPFALYAYDFSSERDSVYSMWKKNYVENYANFPTYGLVFDPDNDHDLTNDLAVSEGVGYGMLIAVMQEDQDTFDNIFQAAETWMWNGTSYDWQIATDGTKIGINGATDADEDIAMALILADNKWHNSDYANKAQILINNIFNNNTTKNGYLKPGDQFGGKNELNLSYFSPAWYRVFDEYENKHHNWKKVIKKQYKILNKISNKNSGLIPDWCNYLGEEVAGRSYNFSYDAIRIPWRLTMDEKFYQNKKAKKYLTKLMTFVKANGGAEESKMYTMNGSAIEYHNELVVAMYASGASSVDANNFKAKKYIKEFKNFYDANQQAFGTWDEAYLSYYNQSLALLAAGLLDGSFKIN